MLYAELADWFHLLSPPEEYGEEAALYADLLEPAARAAAQGRGRPTLLELGAGAGCNAVHLKRRFTCTLTDLSPAMLTASRRLNPECEHLPGDMRTLRLDRTFDAVFVHDAIGYLLTEADLAQALRTAFEHCRPGAPALFVPDCTRETFLPRCESGGTDEPGGTGRGLRYLEWDGVPEPGSTSYAVDFAILLREGGRTRLVHDSHRFGLFSEATWLRLIREAGFAEVSMPRLNDSVETGVMFLARRAP